MGVKQFIKQSILHGAETFGGNRFFRWKTRKNLLGLCYHGVIGDEAPWDDPRARIAVSATQFELQMKELHSHWKPISLAELDECFQSGRPIPKNSVFVSFDDGFLNNLTIAAPILRRYEIPATVFLTTGLIGTENTIWPLELLERVVQWNGDELPAIESLPNTHVPKDAMSRREFAMKIVDHCKTLPVVECQKIVERFRKKSEFRLAHRWQEELYRMLDWNSVRTLLDCGVEIGAHTVSHCNLAQITVLDAEEELRQSKQEIEKNLGNDCYSLAYPFGDPGAFNDSVVETARNLGFRIGTTLCLRRNPLVPDPLRLDRLCVTGDLSLASFRSLISGWRNIY